jgi:hypothetical protein
MCGHILLANYNIECVCCSMVPAAQAGFGSCSVSLARGWQKCKAANAQLFGCISGFLHMTSARICVSGGNIDGTCTSPRMYRRDWPAHRLSWRFRVCSTHTEVETSLNANPQKLQHLKMDKFESSSPTLRATTSWTSKHVPLGAPGSAHWPGHGQRLRPRVPHVQNQLRQRLRDVDGYWIQQQVHPGVCV